MEQSDRRSEVCVVVMLIAHTGTARDKEAEPQYPCTPVVMWWVGGEAARYVDVRVAAALRETPHEDGGGSEVPL